MSLHGPFQDLTHGIQRQWICDLMPCNDSKRHQEHMGILLSSSNPTIQFFCNICCLFYGPSGAGTLKRTNLNPAATTPSLVFIHAEDADFGLRNPRLGFSPSTLPHVAERKARKIRAKGVFGDWDVGSMPSPILSNWKLRKPPIPKCNNVSSRQSPSLMDAFLPPNPGRRVSPCSHSRHIE